MEHGIIAYIGDTIQLADIGKKTVKKTPVTDDARVAAALAYQTAEMAALQAAGFSADQVKFNLVKDWMESGAYTSTGARVNNPGNIMFGNHNINAAKGPYLQGNKSYLASYKTLAGYAVDLKRVLSLSPGRPIDATGYPDPADFVHRLKLNNYFGSESEASYLQKMKSTQQRLRIVAQLQTDTHQDIVVDDGQGGDKFTQWWNGLSMVEKIGLGVAGFAGLVMLTKR